MEDIMHNNTAVMQRILAKAVHDAISGALFLFLLIFLELYISPGTFTTKHIHDILQSL